MPTPSLRRPRTRLFAATTLALAALSLTACDSSASGVRDAGAAPSRDASSATDAAPGPTTGPRGGPPDSKGSAGGSSTPTAAKKHTTTGDPYAPDRRVPCTAANTRISAAPVQRPLNHMLLTVTNTGSKMCDLPGHPIVRFEHAQSVPPVIEDTKPQAAVSLKPGAKGYAGVVLSAGDGSGGEGYSARSLQVGFPGTDAMADAALQAREVHVDAALRVTYWQSDPADALN
ncbi:MULTISPECIES: DUF4232 domain-containing protein [unclassified Streptomyces]|uniref:DUF4232 domain-containing protein n=1 Tax=unclassified Streptomyces TaxID=2593676 RepID=UPI000C27D964|nr:DUF4232 domain-containing protein [Streptomyces sp. CB02959]PJN37778.1 hypothetical protein CG747_27265 [Streptomyces sp. CB02959]